ncbi:MAG: oligosaccharide flippase family protein [candidate division Zixibacteria bacterium]|nr:oligosaccharide flippase family protein [candidate division Zixibacteria bacterium]
MAGKSTIAEHPSDPASQKHTSYRRIFTHSSIYVLGMLISKVVGFVMIPIYTRYLTPADYGILELLTMTSDVIAMLIGVGLAHAVMRFYYNYKEQDDRNQVVSTALIAGLVIFVAGFGALTLESGLAAKLILDSADMANYFTIIFITMMFFAGIEIPLVYLRAQQRSIYFVVVNLVKLVIQLSLNIYFIVVLDWGVLGVLYSGLIASVAVGSFLSVKTFMDTGLRFSIDKFRELLRYGYPLLFTNLGAFILTYSDRYFLKFYTDLNEVGIYSLGYKFGMLVSMLLIAPFHQYWSAEMFAAAKRDDAPKVFRDFFTYSTLLSVVFCFALSIYIRNIIEIMAMESYWPAYKVVPLVCLAYIVMGMQGFAGCGILISKKTRYLAYSTAFAVAANVALNFTLIPQWGAVGAALATIGSFWVRFYTTYRYSQRYFYLKYEWYRIGMALFLAIVLLVGRYLISIDNRILSLLIDTGFVIIYPLILYVIGWFNNREKELITKLVRNPGKITGVVKLYKENA